MGWAWRMYRGAEFCALEVGFTTRSAAESDAQETLDDPARDYTRADISHDGKVCCTIYPVNKQLEKLE